MVTEKRKGLDKKKTKDNQKGMSGWDKENVTEWIKLQVDNRIFFPGKVIKNKTSFIRNQKSLIKSPKNVLSPKNPNLSPKSPISILTKPLKFASPEFSKEHKKLADSLQSYYNSEQQNLDLTGKCQQSYINFKLNYSKMQKKKKNQMKKQIRALKTENSALKQKITSISLKKHKLKKSLTPNARWDSRNSPCNTGRFKQCDSSQTFRKSCIECTDLLACGLSSGHCIEHK